MVVRSYLIVVLICISIIISDVEHFYCVYLLFVYHLWKNIYSDHLPIFSLVCLIFVVELYDIYIYFLNISPSSDM